MKRVMARTPVSTETVSTTPPTLERSLAAIREQLASVLDELRARYRVRSLAVFGSRVRGEAGPDSDLDVLVSFEVLPDLITFTALQQELEDALGMRVDLVLRDSLKPRLRPQILREAVAV